MAAKAEYARVGVWVKELEAKIKALWPQAEEAVKAEETKLETAI